MASVSPYPSEKFMTRLFHFNNAIVAAFKGAAHKHAEDDILKAETNWDWSHEEIEQHLVAEFCELFGLERVDCEKILSMIEERKQSVDDRNIPHPPRINKSKEATDLAAMSFIVWAQQEYQK